jgi:hypothetical protein
MALAPVCMRFHGCLVLNLMDVLLFVASNGIDVIAGVLFLIGKIK